MLVFVVDACWQFLMAEAVLNRLVARRGCFGDLVNKLLNHRRVSSSC